jgi:hypothetical protein
MTRLAGTLTRLLGHAGRLVAPGRRQWAEALLVETGQVPAGWPRLSWLAGGLWVVARGQDDAQGRVRTRARGGRGCRGMGRRAELAGHSGALLRPSGGDRPGSGPGRGGCARRAAVGGPAARLVRPGGQHHHGAAGTGGRLHGGVWPGPGPRADGQSPSPRGQCGPVQPDPGDRRAGAARRRAGCARRTAAGEVRMARR